MLRRRSAASVPADSLLDLGQLEAELGWRLQKARERHALEVQSRRASSERPGHAARAHRPLRRVDRRRRAPPRRHPAPGGDAGHPPGQPAARRRRGLGGGGRGERRARPQESAHRPGPLPRGAPVPAHRPAHGGGGRAEPPAPGGHARAGRGRRGAFHRRAPAQRPGQGAGRAAGAGLDRAAGLHSRRGGLPGHGGPRHRGGAAQRAALETVRGESRAGEVGPPRRRAEGGGARSATRPSSPTSRRASPSSTARARVLLLNPAGAAMLDVDAAQLEGRHVRGPHRRARTPRRSPRCSVPSPGARCSATWTWQCGPAARPRCSPSR